MKTEKAENSIREILTLADIHINGNHPWDIRVNDKSFYQQTILNGSMGAGEAYMEKRWECLRLDEFFNHVFRAAIEDKIRTKWELIAEVFLTKIFNRQTRSRAFRVGQKHYDLDNHLFECMLDKRMTYTGAYWKGATTLDEAQENKLDLTCRKLNLRKGMHILDIGCGWGSFAKFAAEKYGVSVTGITVSKEQVKFGKDMCEGLPVDFILTDYRDMKGKFDHIVSLGMFEHVGVKNYRTYMKVAHRCLKDDGIFLLHTIGGNTSGTTNDAWIDKYIFPNSMLPSIKQIGEAIEGIFVMEDWHNFSADYDRTLMAWNNNFATHWDELKDRYDEKFYRMWTYYLLMCAGSFRARKNQLWQIVLSKKGVIGGYESTR